MVEDTLDAIDRLHAAKDLVQLIEMTTRYDPEDDSKAIAQVCAVIFEHFEAALPVLKDRAMQGSQEAGADKGANASP